MTPQKLLDTHIHLWPSTATSPTDHAWMASTNLGKRHGISDYYATTSATSPIQPSGFIYVETDRYLASPNPDIAISDDVEVKKEKLKIWAKAPIEELQFLRRMVEGKPKESDGFEPEDSEKLVGAVIWAPFHLSTDLFDLYLEIAEGVSGPKLWEKVVGFRYLLQAISDETQMSQLVFSEDFLQNMLRLRQGRGGRGWAFDVGVDAHGKGAWQIEVAADMVDKVRELEGDGKTWENGLKRLAAQPAVYMKLSGAFNEFYPTPTPNDGSDLSVLMEYYMDKVFYLFKSERVMFGSDWPVCNIGGPRGEQSWGLWREVVEKELGDGGDEISKARRERVWWGTGCEAYGVEI
ncbi:hypothetical protein BDV96DRAFT_506051 [Lophiotrema nucula]|uniref:Amidohydrolase-related domain-containing protein n=1 Tax=Lophiotrema nucula TaxID=690887 RepID=A0A6A5YMJ7_9PLEO|nr:hypothetical protein BDV96DRAFT_506051 [Lophiotrema nucula]